MDAPVFEISLLSWDYGLRVAGELDASSAPTLAKALDELDREEPIVLDFEELTFIDSVGVHTILAYARSCEGSTPLVIANPSPALLRVLEILDVPSLPSVEIRVDEPVVRPAR